MKEESLSPWEVNLDLTPANNTNAVCFLKETANKLLTICNNENGEKIKKRLSRTEKSKQMEPIILRQRQKKMRYISECEETQVLSRHKTSKIKVKEHKQVSLLPQFGLYKTTIVHKTFMIENVNYSRRYFKETKYGSSRFEAQLSSLKNKGKRQFNEILLTATRNTTGVRGLRLNKMEQCEQEQKGIKRYNLFNSSNW